MTKEAVTIDIIVEESGKTLKDYTFTTFTRDCNGMIITSLKTIYKIVFNISLDNNMIFLKRFNHKKTNQLSMKCEKKKQPQFTAMNHCANFH